MSDDKVLYPMNGLTRKQCVYFGLLVMLEGCQMAASRYVLKQYPDAVISVEMFRTVLRMGSAALYWWWFKDLFLMSPVNTKALRQPHLVALTIMVLLIPILCANDRLPPEAAVVFAFTSIFVGIKEEILFRGVLQGVCRRFMSPVKSVVLISLVFTVWHYGVQPFNVYTVSQLLVAGLVLGLMYEATRSLLLVIGVHTLYDVLYAISPVVAKPYHPLLGWFIGMYCVGLAYSWAAKHLVSKGSANS